MKYISIAAPAPSVGSRTGSKKLTVPNQSMSLEEILRRFTRGEPLAIGREGSFNEEVDEDLEKLATRDLVDRQEYVDKLKQKQELFKQQDKARKAAALEKYMAKKAEEKIMADKKAAEKTEEPEGPKKA